MSSSKILLETHHSGCVEPASYFRAQWPWGLGSVGPKHLFGKVRIRVTRLPSYHPIDPRVRSWIKYDLNPPPAPNWGLSYNFFIKYTWKHTVWGEQTSWTTPGSALYRGWGDWPKTYLWPCPHVSNSQLPSNLRPNWPKGYSIKSYHCTRTGCRTPGFCQKRPAPGARPFRSTILPPPPTRGWGPTWPNRWCFRGWTPTPCQSSAS